MSAGTCASEAPLRTEARISASISALSSTPSGSLTKRTMRTSPALLPTLIWSPITSESSTTPTHSAKRYTSAVPMRTPPGLRVVSERPWMITPPLAPTEPVVSTRSPWYQVPEPPSKYAPRYFDLASSSPKKHTGAATKGARQTSSALLPTTGFPPSRSYAHASRPRPKACSSPLMTGRVGLPSAKQEQMSVPPEIEARLTSGLTFVYTYS
mmetsp:Transcript_20338/g.34644  ORF Transcript_20338/g.34644 Transcript_20338/m.34644 type:complete len:211 (+) Transcript_20338:559-1191(+)